jgi:hypothetical protein
MLADVLDIGSAKWDDEMSGRGGCVDFEAPSSFQLPAVQNVFRSYF